MGILSSFSGWLLESAMCIFRIRGRTEGEACGKGDLMVLHLPFHPVFLCRRGTLGPLRDSWGGVWLRSGICNGTLVPAPFEALMASLQQWCPPLRVYTILLFPIAFSWHFSYFSYWHTVTFFFFYIYLLNSSQLKSCFDNFVIYQRVIKTQGFCKGSLHKRFHQDLSGTVLGSSTEKCLPWAPVSSSWRDTNYPGFLFVCMW